MRTVIIGDIHGCADTFARMLDAVQLDTARDKLILLGDLFDRGPNSYQVFRKAQCLKEEMGDRFVLIKGSHEWFLLEERLSFRDKQLWNHIGRRQTAQSFRANGQKLSSAIPWMRENARLYHIEPEFVCVHAGLVNEDPEQNDEMTLLMDHDVTRRNLYAGRLAVTGHIHLREPTYFDGSGGEGEILPFDETMPLPQTGVICIDTGCGEGGILTAMLAENGRFTLKAVREDENHQSESA